MNTEKNNSSDEIMKSSLLVKNTLWNTLGIILPLFVGLFSIPILIEELGTESFGILTIVWMIIGYFSIFDFGLGRALTKLIAENLGKESQENIPGLFWTAIIMMICAGIIGTVVMFFLSEPMVYLWLNIEQSHQSDSLTSFYILSFSIPVVIATTGFRGVLEAYQKFAIVNKIRVPLGILTFLGPLAVIPFSTSLSVIVVVLLFGRLLGLYAYYYYCLQTVPILRKEIVFDKSKIKPLFRFGGWMTVINVVGPMIAYLDRFLIGSILTMTAVTYFVAQYEIVTKLLLLPMGLLGVLFPAFSTMLNSNREKAVFFFKKGTNIIFYVMFPILLTINLFAHEGITIWLGSEFAENGSGLMKWLSIGVFLNSIARMPFVMIQSAGRPDLIAKLFLIQIPFYILALWYSLVNFGIEGAAIVWMIRIYIDTIAMLILSKKVVCEVGRFPIIIIAKLSIAISILYLVTFAQDIMIKGLLLFALVFFNGLLGWKFSFSFKERAGIIRSIRNKLVGKN